MTNLLSTTLVGVYAWAVTLFFGMVLLDVIYARREPGAVPADSRIADFLLLAGLAVLVLSIFATVSAWRSSLARSLLLLSLAVLLLEFAVPPVLGPLMEAPLPQSITLWMRILPPATASILAFISLYVYTRR